MDSNEVNAKIDLINAYRQLSGTTLKLSKSTPETAVNVVQLEFQSFVASRIEELLNGKQDNSNSPAGQLTNEDVQVLLALIENVKNKQKLNEAASAAQVPQRNPQPQQQIRGGNPNAKPLKDQDPSGEKYRNANETLLSRLAKMENQGPEF